MAGTSKVRSEPRAVTRGRRSLREHRNRWNAAIDAAGRLAAAVGYVKAAAANTHAEDSARLERVAARLWTLGDQLNEAAIDGAQSRQKNRREG